MQYAGDVSALCPVRPQNFDVERQGLRALVVWARLPLFSASFRLGVRACYASWPRVGISPSTVPIGPDSLQSSRQACRPVPLPLNLPRPAAARRCERDSRDPRREFRRGNLLAASRGESRSQSPGAH